MKKNIILLVFALCCVLANATDFGLKIAGRDITSDGYIDAGQSTGKIYWNGTSLTFTDVEVNHTSTSTAFVSYTG